MIEFLSLAVSAAALVVSAAALGYTRKKYLLLRAEFVEREKDSRRARFATRVERQNRGFRLVLINTGPAEARNVTCNFAQSELENLKLSGGFNAFPLQSMQAGESVALNAYLWDKRRKRTMRVCWDDDTGQGNHADLVFVLN